MAPKEIRGVIAKFKRALREADFPAVRVLIFGSYSRSEARPDSDIDVCLISKAFHCNKESYRKKAVFIAFHVDPRIQIVLFSPAEFKKNKLSALIHHIKKEAVAA